MNTVQRRAGAGRFLLGCLALVVLLVSCLGPSAPSAPPPSPTPPASPAAEPGAVSAPEATAPSQPEPEPSPAPISVWVAPALPAALRAAIELPAGFAASPETEGVQLRIAVGGGHTLSEWVYALVAPFPTVSDAVSLDDLRSAWGGAAAGPFAGRPLLLAPETLAVLSDLWQPPQATAVQVMPGEELLDYAWNHRPAWAIIPFEAIEPRWKVLEVDGQSPLRKDFQQSAYGLTVPVSVNGPEPEAGALADGLRPGTPPSNRDAARLTTVVMTGVTALVRATAAKMEQKGVTYPGGGIRDWLREADFTHISNEIAFSPTCPAPDPSQQQLIFCSDPRYIELLQDVGTDLVELTGNHLEDWGSSAMLYTLGLYRERGWLYFGGGSNLEDSFRPAIVEHNGTRLAFLGCNAAGPETDWATETRPGSTPCDYDRLRAEVAQLRQEGILPIFTFQYYEYYTYEPRPGQERDFGSMADAGAVIVSGSQAHRPQAMTFRDGAFIHYGLGNLFFDQMVYVNQFNQVVPGTRWEFVDRHVFYGGRYLGTELLTAMLEDYARPRPMTPAERAQLLSEVFAASGW